MRRYEVRKVGGRVFCCVDPRPEVPEGTTDEVRHYTKPMVGVVEVAGQYMGQRFVIPREQFEGGTVLAAPVSQ